ncbi:MAG: hypothetical protein FWF91_06810 [Coriobacteriia bacterium]|nr:hypothetical protein [Coriobacteriia bacterium]
MDQPAKSTQEKRKRTAKRKLTKAEAMDVVLKRITDDFNSEWDFHVSKDDIVGLRASLLSYIEKLEDYSRFDLI